MYKNRQGLKIFLIESFLNHILNLIDFQLPAGQLQESPRLWFRLLLQCKSLAYLFWACVDIACLVVALVEGRLDSGHGFFKYKVKLLQQHRTERLFSFVLILFTIALCSQFPLHAISFFVVPLFLVCHNTNYLSLFSAGLDSSCSSMG